MPARGHPCRSLSLITLILQYRSIKEKFTVLLLERKNWNSHKRTETRPPTWKRKAFLDSQQQCVNLPIAMNEMRSVRRIEILIMIDSSMQNEKINPPGRYAPPL